MPFVIDARLPIHLGASFLGLNSALRTFSIQILLTFHYATITYPHNLSLSLSLSLGPSLLFPSRHSSPFIALPSLLVACCRFVALSPFVVLCIFAVYTISRPSYFPRSSFCSFLRLTLGFFHCFISTSTSTPHHILFPYNYVVFCDVS